MKGKKKQLLGFFGLALVFAMTAIAYSLPAPEAAAQDLNVSVTVVAEEGSANITKPLEGEVFTGRTTNVEVSYNKIKSMSIGVVCKNASGAEVFNQTRTPALTDGAGVAKEAFTLPEGLGDVSCVASMDSVDLNGNAVKSDSVSFKFRSMNIPDSGSEDNPVKPPVNPDEPCEGPNCGKFDEENNPIVDVIVSDDVEQVSVQVYDMNGRPVFVDKDGKETPLLVGKDAFKDGRLNVTLPMSDYKAKPGKYVAYFTATNGEGDVVSVNEYWFEYMPVVETPGTGSIFKDMNLSSADYLVAGLVAFGAVAGFAVYLVFRKARR